jgi:hypothetical protein
MIIWEGSTEPIVNCNEVINCTGHRDRVVASSYVVGRLIEQVE